MKYDKDIDYRKLIDAAASRGDYENAARYELARNAKIDGEGMSYGKTNDYAKYLPFESGVDYAEKAGKLAAAGDFGGAYDALYGATNSRQAKVDFTGDDYGKTNDDIYYSYISKYGGKQSEAIAPYLPLLTGVLKQDNSFDYKESDYAQKAREALDQAAAMRYEDYLKSGEYADLSKQYGENGKRAMEDTLAQIAARTGGMASSYAGHAAQQAYDRYMGELSDKAYERYGAQRDALYKAASAYQGVEDTEYQKYVDALTQKNNERNFKANLIGDIMNASRTGYADALSKETADRNDARERVMSIIEATGSYGTVPEDLLSASGLTTAELDAAVKSVNDAKNAQKAAEKTKGSSSSDKAKGTILDQMPDGMSESEARVWLRLNGGKLTEGAIKDYVAFYMAQQNESDKTDNPRLTDTDPYFDNYSEVADVIKEGIEAGASQDELRGSLKEALNAGVITAQEYKELLSIIE